MAPCSVSGHNEQSMGPNRGMASRFDTGVARRQEVRTWTLPAESAHFPPTFGHLVQN